MNNKAASTVLAIAAAVLISGCGSEQKEQTATQTDTATSTAPSTNTPPSQGLLDSSKPSDSNAKTVTTPSGLQYEDIKEGTGAMPQPGQMVTVHYTGWLKSDGSKFDSSVDRGEPFQFQLGAGQVIKGWDEGVASMKVGGKRRLTIPANLAYGDHSPTEKIPPGSTLVFDVELLGAQ